MYNQIKGDKLEEMPRNNKSKENSGKRGRHEMVMGQKMEGIYQTPLILALLRVGPGRNTYRVIGDLSRGNELPDAFLDRS